MNWISTFFYQKKKKIQNSNKCTVKNKQKGENQVKANKKAKEEDEGLAWRHSKQANPTYSPQPTHVLVLVPTVPHYKQLPANGLGKQVG